MGSITINSSVTRAYAPDVVNFNIHISRVADSSAELTLYNKDMLDKLVDGMKELNILDDNLKELYFRIGVNKERVDDNYVCKGYKLDSGYAISSYVDYELMDDIREMLAGLELEFSVEYSLEDEEDIRESLLAEAVEKSLCKARIIASAGGSEVGAMCDVRYNDMTRSPMLLRANAPSGDAVPRDIEITESVEVEWEIKED